MRWAELLALRRWLYTCFVPPVCDQRLSWLQDQRAACLRWLTSIPPPPPRCKSCFCHVDVNVCANVLRCVCPVPTLYSSRSIVWGSPFVSLLPSPHVMLLFSPQSCHSGRGTANGNEPSGYNWVHLHSCTLSLLIK